MDVIETFMTGCSLALICVIFLMFAMSCKEDKRDYELHPLGALRKAQLTDFPRDRRYGHIPDDIFT